MIKYNVEELNGNKVYYLLSYLKNKYRLSIPALNVVGLFNDEDKINFEKDFIDLWREAYKEEVMCGDSKFYLLEGGNGKGKGDTNNGRKSNKGTNKGKK